jgi:hypothetical protein
MKINKIIFNVFLPLLALSLILGACRKNDDLLTADAKTGGLAIATESFPYKLGATPTVPLSLQIPMGPGISKIEVFNQYTGTVQINDTVSEVMVSNKVLMSTVEVSSGNAAEELIKSFSVGYVDLIKGITFNSSSLPSDETLLPIGDKWELTYESIMEDGRRVVNNAKTTIAVANIYAGSYQCDGVFTHPTAGPRNINEEKFLTPLSAYSCSLPAGDLGSSGYSVTITVDPATNDVSFSNGTPAAMSAQSSKRSYYDPSNGHFYLHYFYVGGTGNRLMDEEYTPLGK